MQQDKALNDTALSLLFAADRADHSREIQTALHNQEIVLCDRYLCSSIAYQNCPSEWILEINKYSILPDLVLILDIPVEIAGQRRKSRDFKDFLENDEILQQARTKYLRLGYQSNVHIVDGTQKLQDVTSICLQKILDQLKK